MTNNENGSSEPTEPTEDEFEAVVAALLKVDPTGIAGKHRKDEDDTKPAPKAKGKGR